MKANGSGIRKRNFSVWTPLRDSGGKFDKWGLRALACAALYGSERFLLQPLVREEQRIVSIDGGCVLKASGQINVLMIPDLAQDGFRFTSLDCLPTVVAQDAQEASALLFASIDRQRNRDPARK